MTIILGVTGGIAAYKSAEIARRLIERDLTVKVIMTDAATRFITPLTMRTITDQYVATSMFDENLPSPSYHIKTTEEADILLVAPATADFIAKMAYGLADDLLSSLVLAFDGRICVAPSMHSRMYMKDATQENLKTLSDRGTKVIGPVVGKLAEGEGIGRMASIGELVSWVETATKRSSELKGKTVLVTAGGTREPIDAVRYIGNESSGRMGLALAEEAHERGADVVLVSTVSDETVSSGIRRIDVKTAEDMYREVMSCLDKTDVLVMAAAVADVRPIQPKKYKVRKKEISTIEIEPTLDILEEISGHKDGKIVVGFAAETDDLEESARSKLANKKLDIIVANDVSRRDIGFQSNYNQALIITKSGKRIETDRVPKRKLASMVFDEIRDIS